MTHALMMRQGTNAEQWQRQHRGVYRVRWIKKTKLQSHEKKKKKVSHYQRVWYQSEILNPNLKEKELWNCGEHSVQVCWRASASAAS